MITLVLGGARSGKSQVAEQRAATLAGSGAVTCVVTGVDGGDADFAARIQAHRERRPPSWTTVEGGADLAGATAGVATDVTVLIDSLGTWVGASDDLTVDVGPLVEAVRARTAPTVIVSDEVGLGVHPSTEEGRRFRDALGDVNRTLATIADEVLLVVAGRVLPLDRP